MSEQKVMAVVEVGSTGIRLIVAAVEASGEYRVLDHAGKPVQLGRDVFVTGSVSRGSMLEVIAVLRGFRELLKTYGIESKDARVIATSALREADNRDTFIDRIALQTGFSVDIVEDIEENHLMYLAVQKALGDEFRSLSRGNSLIIEVGGGSTELMLLRRGRMTAAHSLRIGTIRADEQVRAAMGTSAYLERYLKDHVRTTCDNLDSELSMATVRSFVLIGSDARFAARTVGVRAGSGDYYVVSRAAFVGFVQEILELKPEGVVAKYGVAHGEAESYAVGLLIAKLFLERTAAAELVVPFVSIRDGYLMRLTQGPSDSLENELHRQVLASTAALGRRFHFDEDHARHVLGLALELFDRLADEHGLGRRERLLLEVAALLHDVGTFIRTSGHHKHSEYIIANSEVFGLQRDDLTIIANCARYHRKAGPSQSHPSFMSLPREDRILVLKLSAILRVADALDRGHTQRVRLVDCERREDHLVIRAEDCGELSLERLSLEEKGDMFEDVFGMKAVLA
ncbi:MAG TPA: HD domain-containing protein [Magnetospirillaceae bacterium]|nr:HD domain-containing protein [Magnetospirillaceae bacterium]